MNITDENERADGTIVSLRLCMDVDRAKANDHGSSTESRFVAESHKVKYLNPSPTGKTN